VFGLGRVAKDGSTAKAAQAAFLRSWRAVGLRSPNFCACMHELGAETRMMGHREHLRNGDEWDAFSRRARRIVGFGRGVLGRIKRSFHKRTRRNAKIEALRHDG
jgi:hypothetical protein